MRQSQVNGRPGMIKYENVHKKSAEKYGEAVAILELLNSAPAKPNQNRLIGTNFTRYLFVTFLQKFCHVFLKQLLPAYS